MRLLFAALFLAPVILFAQAAQEGAPSTVASVKYNWKKPAGKVKDGIRAATIIEGSVHDFEYLAVDACEVLPSKTAVRSEFQVPADEEHLMLVKSGTLNISIGDSSWSIGPGSIALLMPGQRYAIARGQGSLHYLMRYRSRDPVDMTRGLAEGGSMVRDWNKLRFREHSRGGVRSYFERATAMSKRFEMHVTTLKPGLKSHEPHTHRAEEIILMLEDGADGKARTEMLIGERTFQGEAGDIYYVGTGLLHGIRNIGTVTCSYFAFQFE